MRTGALKSLVIANSLIGFGACAWAQDIGIGKAETPRGDQIAALAAQSRLERR